MQHAVLGLFKEMLFTLDLAQHAGTQADRKAAERLQHRCFCCPCSTISRQQLV